MAGRLVLLATTHRVAPGLLSWPAWSALHEADEVYASTADHPLAAALDAADVTLRVPETTDDVGGFLVRRARAADVVWLMGVEGDQGLADELARRLATDDDLPEVELVAGSWDVPGARLLDLVAVMDRLRSPGGCPWDAAQTHRSLLPYLLEEAYEAVEAVETDDLVGLREEMGDLLLQVVFHARLGEEHPEEPWSVDDVAAGIVDKLVSRHPHVFGGAAADTPEQVEQSWEELKRAEKGRSSVVEGVPLAQPALALAAALVERADRAGLAVPVDAVPVDAVPVDAVPVDAVPVDAVPVDAAERALGSVLLALAADAVRSGADPEAALRAAARSYAERVRAAEAEAGR